MATSVPRRAPREISRIPAQLKPVALIAALNSEAACLARRKPVPYAPVTLDDRFTLVLGGIGPERAARAAGRMIGDGACALMSIGMAGALDAGIAPGDVILPETVEDADGSMPTSASWRMAIEERLVDAGLRVHRGLLRSVSAVLDSPAGKAALCAATGAVAVDMESTAIVRTSARHGVPAAVLRVVLDPAHMSIPTELLAVLDAYGGIRAARLLAAISGRPAMIPALVRLARAQSTARGVLTRLGRRRHELLAPDAVS